ncbi:hypothetical protein ACFL3V_02720 [Nanoarchaeota archaeon]
MTGTGNSSQKSCESFSGRPTPSGVVHLTGTAASYIPAYTEFYQRIQKGHTILDEIKKRGAGHGVTFLIVDKGVTSDLEEYLDDAVPFNGRPHFFDDVDITDVVQKKREVDGAFLVDADEQLTHAGVGLPYDMPQYKRQYGIKDNISSFMGFDLEKEDPVGLRNRSALYASNYFGDNVAILTLGESGEINLYYCGNRVYNSAGREVHWEMAERVPSMVKAVMDMDRPDPDLAAAMMKPQERPKEDPPAYVEYRLAA